MGTLDGVLLERDADLRTIAQQLDRACAGDGTSTVIEGPAGIGKTRLLDAAARMGRERGMSVVRARGGVLEQELDFGVARQVLEGGMTVAGPDGLGSLETGPTAPAAAVLGTARPPPDAGPVHDPSADILRSLYWVTVALAEAGPFLMVLDDAHWADASSLRAGGYMAERLDGVRVAFLLATRDDEPHSNRDLVSGLTSAADSLVIRPGGLTADSVGRILHEAFGVEPPPELAQACTRASGGNPFFMTELARELASVHDDPATLAPESVDEVGPAAVRRFLLLRLGRLGDDARRMAQAVATLGGEGELRHAAAVAGLDPDAAERAADVLADAGILDAGRPLRMNHPLVRAAVTGELRGADEASLHRRAYEVLRDDGARSSVAVTHALKAGPAGDPGVVELLTRSSTRALRNGSPQVAAVHLNRALAEPPTPEARGPVMAALGRAEVRQGAFADARVHLDQALGLLSDPGARLDAQRDRAFAAFAGGGMRDARHVVTDVLGELRGRDDDAALQIEADLALLAWLSGDDHQLDLNRHLELAGHTRAERTMLALLAQSEHATGTGPDRVVELAERALGGGTLIEEDTSEALSWYMATYALLTCEAHEAARATIEHALDDSRKRGSAFARAGALGCRAVLALNEGRPRDAEADALTAAGSIPPVMAPVNAAYIVLALVDQGELEEADAELERAGLAHGPGGPTVMRWIPWARARLREAQGRPADAAEAVACLEDDDRAGRPMRALAWRALLARSLARGQGDRAATLAAEHLAWARSWARPCALGVAQRAGALAGPSTERVAALEEAVATLAASSLHTEEARARADLGVALLRSGQRRDGRAQLDAAVEVAVACGARGVAEAASAELEVAGAPAKRLAFDELTASERRVAELAAAGASNREVAEELSVTPKTVENHLTRVYAKLGLASRAELSTAL
ncbi:MAG TPA: AAA family ATPase [Thermoleophilaceae bacterium]|nr:AAA family ATPase [Thermoleophilaceae bacterium]